MSQEQLRRLLDALYSFAHEAESHDDHYNLGGRLLSVAGAAITEEPAHTWFAYWREGQPPHLAPSAIQQSAPEVADMTGVIATAEDKGSEE